MTGRATVTKTGSFGPSISTHIAILSLREAGFRSLPHHSEIPRARFHVNDLSK